MSRTQEDLLHLAMMQGWVEPRDKREDHAILALVRIGYLEPINERVSQASEQFSKVLAA